VAELHEGVEQFPHFGVVGAEDSKIDFKFLVDCFCFSIGLRVIYYASERFDSQESGHFSEDLGGKLWAAVR